MNAYPDPRYYRHLQHGYYYPYAPQQFHPQSPLTIAAMIGRVILQVAQIGFMVQATVAEHKQPKDEHKRTDNGRYTNERIP